VATAIIDWGMDLGYRVVINDVWSQSEERFCERFATICGPERPRAVHRALHARYHATLVYTDPLLGPFYELTRRPNDE
jgi:hypothetical protein